MKNTNIQFILAGIAEEAAPSAEIDLWKGISQHLETSESRFHIGETLMKPNFAQRPIVRRVALAALVLVLAFAILLATPQGRAWAQEVIHFFTRAESDTLPLQPWQKTAIYQSHQETATPILETVTPDPDNGYVFKLSVTEAGQMAGFDALEPTWLPDILTFAGASYQSEHNIVRIFYRYNQDEPDTTNGLVLREERFRTNDDCALCGVVGASEKIEIVTIGNTTGEYIIGVWTLTDNGPVWESTPYLKTLRWQANGMAFELLYMGIPDEDGGITKADMIAIAESMMK